MAGFELVNLAEIERAHERLLAENERAITESLELAGRHGVEHVERFPEFRPRTGNLQKNTKARVVRLGSGKILRLTNDAAYADAIDQGARAHVIVPRRGKYLRFIGRDGRTVFTRRVNHPGNKPYRFMFFAHDAANRVFKRDIERRMSLIASRF